MTRRTDKLVATRVRGVERTHIEIESWDGDLLIIRAVREDRWCTAYVTPAGLRKLQRDIGRHLSRLEKKR